MHWVYYIYLFVCVSQFPIFCVLSASHVRVTYFQLEVTSAVNATLTSALDISSINNSTTRETKNSAPAAVTSVVVWLSANKQNTDLQAGSCTMLAVLFAILYMCLTSIDEELFVLGQPDADIPDPKVKKSIDFIRIIFWLFVWIQAYIINVFVINSSSSSSSPANPFISVHMLGILPQDTYITTSMRACAIWCACRTAPGDKQSLGRLVGCVWLYIMWLSKTTTHASHYGYLLIAGQLSLDFILILGHIYDTSTTSMVVLNCRLFFVACASTWIQTAACLSP